MCVCRYVTVLVELTRIEGTKHGRLIASQMLDVAIRVQAVRPFVVVQMVRRDVVDLVLYCAISVKWYDVVMSLISCYIVPLVSNGTTS